MFCNTLLCGFIDFIIFPCADYDNQHVIVMTDKLERLVLFLFPRSFP